MKEAERSFVCPACDHRFKLKHHLQNHRKVCKRINVNNEVRVFKCKDCDKAFKLKHHLTVHEKNVHNDRKEYKCKTCDKMVPFNDKVKHIKEEHQKFCYDYCAYIGDKRNKKRHMRSKHSAYPINVTLAMNENKQQKNKCDECQKYFFCKSTLNRHIKRLHQKNNDKINCDKVDKKKTDKINCEKSNENIKPSFISNIISDKKQIQFKDNIEQVWEIPFTKTNIHGKENDLIYMFMNVERVLTIVTNRNQRVTTSVLIETVERISKKNLTLKYSGF